MSDEEKVRQEASGIGNAQANNNSWALSLVNIFGEYPIERKLFAELLAASVVQVLLHMCGFYSIFFPDAYFLLCLYVPVCFGSPLVFGLHALYGFTMGITKQDAKLIAVSIVSGALSFVPVILYLVYRVLLGG